MQISIRRFEERDIEKKVAWINDPRNNTYLHYDLPLEVEKTRLWFQKNRDRLDRFDAVIEADGVPVGLIGLLGIDDRNRKAEYYVACVTQAYRMAVDEYAAAGFAAEHRVSDWITQETEKVSHRPYGTGFYFGQPAQDTARGGYIRDFAVAAVVEGYQDGYILATQRNRFFDGDTLDALIPGQPPCSIEVCGLQNGDGEGISSAPHPMMSLRIPHPHPLPVGSMLRMVCK